VTVKVWPPAVIVPVRCAVVEFAATLNVTVPVPDPVAPPVTVIQATLLVAVQPQPLEVVTEKDPLPPAAVTD
jgi:hypothetical protein